MSPIAFSPNGKSIAFGCPEDRDDPRQRDPTKQARTVRIWDVATGKELHRLNGELKGLITQVFFSPDGKSVFACGYDTPVHCWDLVGGGPPRTIGDFQSIGFLAFSRDGRTLTAITPYKQDWWQRVCARWDVTTGKELGRHTLSVKGQAEFTTPVVWANALSPDGRVLAAANAEGKSIALLDPLTGKELARAGESDHPVYISFSADGTTLSGSSKDGIARVWDAATGKLRARFKALTTGIEANALSPNGKVLALCGRADDGIHLWDVDAGRELHPFAGHRGGLLMVTFVGDGKQVATVSRDRGHFGPYVTEWADWSFRRWDSATGAELQVTRHNPEGEVYLTAFSADGRLLASVIHDGTLRVWDVANGKQLRSWKVPTEDQKFIHGDGNGGKKVLTKPHPAIISPAFSPEGRTVFAANGETILGLEIATGQELPSVGMYGTTKQKWQWGSLSSDTRTMALVSASDKVALMDAATGKFRNFLKSRPWGQPVFSPDGRTLTVADRGVSLWEVASGRPRGQLAAPGRVSAIAFSSDGRRLAACSASPQAIVLLWDLAAGELVGQFQCDIDNLDSLAFSQDGTRLAVTGWSATALVYDVAALSNKNKPHVIKDAELSAERLEQLWLELIGSDGERAYRAIQTLGAADPRTVGFLKARLGEGPKPDERRIAQLIANLDSEEFATREKVFGH
jgi:WD40 repeat protein